MKLFFNSICKILFTTFLVTTLTFFLMHIIPGNPFSGNKNLPQPIIKNLEKRYHLNEPLFLQYIIYMKGIVKGDLGPSLKYANRSVNEILFTAFPISLLLGTLALLIAIPFGILFGIFSAIGTSIKSNLLLKALGKFSLLFITLGISLPNFLIAAILINIFAMRLKLLPVALLESPIHFILPVFTLSLLPLAYIARIVRTNMIKELNEDYVKTALAKGLKFRTIILKHTLKNCLISTITILGPIIAILVTGSFVIEYIFGIPGMGRYFITAFTNRDYFLITGTTIIFSVILTTLNVIIDNIYKKIDPRIT